MGVHTVSTKAGDRLDFDGGVQVIVTKGGEGDITHSAGGEGLKVGKRYQDEDTGIEVLVTKPGDIAVQWQRHAAARAKENKVRRLIRRHLTKREGCSAGRLGHCCLLRSGAYCHYDPARRTL